MLLAQYTITGYDASAHMTEETHEADVSGPEGDLEVHRDTRSSSDTSCCSASGTRCTNGGYDAAAAFQPANREPGGTSAIFFDAWRLQGIDVFMLLIVVGAQFFCGMAR